MLTKLLRVFNPPVLTAIHPHHMGTVLNYHKRMARIAPPAVDSSCSNLTEWAYIRTATEERGKLPQMPFAEATPTAPHERASVRLEKPPKAEIPPRCYVGDCVRITGNTEVVPGKSANRPFEVVLHFSG